MARGDPPTVDAEEKGSGRARGCGARRRARTAMRSRAGPSQDGHDPMEGVLVRPLAVLLNKGRSGRAWHDGVRKAVTSPAREASRSRGPPKREPAEARVRSSRPRVHRATESARASQVRSGFLSRWAQEVGGQRWVPPGSPRRAATTASRSCHGQPPWRWARESGQRELSALRREPTR